MPQLSVPTAQMWLPAYQRKVRGNLLVPRCGNLQASVLLKNIPELQLLLNAASRSAGTRVAATAPLSLTPPATPASVRKPASDCQLPLLLLHLPLLLLERGWPQDLLLLLLVEQGLWQLQCRLR